VTSIVIRNDHDHWRAYAAAATGHDIDIHYEGWPIRTFRSEQPMNGRKIRAAQTRQQRLVDRLYAALRYANPKRRLTQAEQTDVELGFHISPDQRQFTIDYTRAANTLVRLALDYQRRGLPEHFRQIGLFEQRAAEEPEEEKESLYRVARETMTGLVDKLPTYEVKPILQTVIAAITILVGVLGTHYLNLHHSLDTTVASYQHEQKLLELKNTTVVTKINGRERVDSTAAEAVERELEAERRAHYAFLDEAQHDPLLHFVSTEVQASMPSLMEIAPLIGITDFGHGQQIDGRAAQAAAKELRQEQRKARRQAPPTDGWVTVTNRA